MNADSGLDVFVSIGDGGVCGGGARLWGCIGTLLRVCRCFYDFFKVAVFFLKNFFYVHLHVSRQPSCKKRSCALFFFDFLS